MLHDRRRILFVLITFNTAAYRVRWNEIRRHHHNNKTVIWTLVRVPQGATNPPVPYSPCVRFRDPLVLARIASLLGVHRAFVVMGCASLGKTHRAYSRRAGFHARPPADKGSTELLGSARGRRHDAGYAAVFECPTGTYVLSAEFGYPAAWTARLREPVSSTFSLHQETKLVKSNRSKMLVLGGVL